MATCGTNQMGVAGSHTTGEAGHEARTVALPKRTTTWFLHFLLTCGTLSVSTFLFVPINVPSNDCHATQVAVFGFPIALVCGQSWGTEIFVAMFALLALFTLRHILWVLVAKLLVGVELAGHATLVAVLAMEDAAGTIDSVLGQHVGFKAFQTE